MTLCRRSRSTLTCALIALAAWAVLAHNCYAQGTTPPAAPQATPPAPTAPAAPAQSPSAPAAPAPATAAADPKLTLSGLFDVYYLWQFSNPNSHIPQNNLGVPIFNSRFNTPSISLAELNAAMAPPTSGGFGFKASLQAGDTADINHGGLGTDPAFYPEARYKNIQQLYVTGLDKSGWGADLGEFYTPFGYEVVESNGNFNYSRSLIFQNLLPVYHTGLRVYSPSMRGFVVTLYLVRALSNSSREGVLDDNHQPGYIGNFVYTDPKGKFTAAESIGYSEDKNIVPFNFQPNFTLPVAPYTDKITLSDTDFTYNLNPTNTIGLNFTWRQDHFPQGVPNNTANGYAAYYRNQFTKRNAVALRYDTIQSHQAGAGTASPQEFTVTLEDKPAASFLTRLEYRHDQANQKVYADGDNLGKSQDTLTISEVYAFP